MPGSTTVPHWVRMSTEKASENSQYKRKEENRPASQLQLRPNKVKVSFSVCFSFTSFTSLYCFSFTSLDIENLHFIHPCIKQNNQINT